MRSIFITLGALVLAAPATAQSWEEYSDPDYAFSVTCPAKPLIQNTTYQVGDNRSVPARVYSVRRNESELTITIADLAGTSLDETAVIDRAIKMLSSGGDMMFNIPQRIDSVYGRSVGIKGGDGSRFMIGVFDRDSTAQKASDVKARITTDLPGESTGAPSYGSIAPWTTCATSSSPLRHRRYS